MAGCFFKRGEVYLNTITGEYHLSLGFMEFAAGYPGAQKRGPSGRLFHIKMAARTLSSCS